MSHQSALNDLIVLLLEDDALISIDTEDALVSLGAARVLVAHTIDESEEIIARETIHAAVLDLVIGRGKSDALACRILERGIPVIFASGFDNSASLPEELRARPHRRQALLPPGALRRPQPSPRPRGNPPTARELGSPTGTPRLPVTLTACNRKRPQALCRGC